MTTRLSAHSFSFPSLTGGQINLAAFAGKTVLVVNSASDCGFTGQYEALQTLFDDYQDRGLVVLAIPSNDFGAQESGTNAEIASFCSTKFDVTFPMAAKQIVKGAGAHPFFEWVVGELGGVSRPRWNFYKYLIGPDGQAISWFSSMTRPDSKKLIKAIEAALGEQKAAS